MKVLWQICTSAPLLHHSAPHRFGLQSLSFVLLSSACHIILFVLFQKDGRRSKEAVKVSEQGQEAQRQVIFLATIVVQLPLCADGFLAVEATPYLK